MSIATTNALLVALFDGVGESTTPTANFTPPSGYPLVNVTNSQLFSRTRTPDLTADRQLTWDLGAPTHANVFGLFGTNASLNTTKRFRSASNAGFTTNVVESGSALTAAFDSSLGFSIATYVPPWGRSLIYIHPTDFTNRYVRWHQTDSSNTDGYQEWGIARLGLAWQPTIGFDSGSSRAEPKYVGPPGAQKILRGHQLTLHNLTKSEAYDLQSLFLSVLNSRRMLVIPEPLAVNTHLHDALWCVLESTYVREPIAGMPYSDKRYRMVVVFREVDR